MLPIRTLRQAYNYLAGFFNWEKNLKTEKQSPYRLERMKRLLDLFSHPEQSFNSLHLAGSKGKGSTAVMLASILTCAGYKTGLYTSPHVSDLRERILINQKMIKPKLFICLLEEIRQKIEAEPLLQTEVRPTFFEILTLLAFLAFRKTNCAYAVIETGLGGRLDATNTIRPLASVLTPIELEHQEILGDTLAKIAFEKCGIIKAGVSVFVGKQPKEVKRQIAATCKQNKSPLFFLEDELLFLKAKVSLHQTEVDLRLKGGPPLKFILSLKGGIQAENAALATLLISRLFPHIPLSCLERGLKKAFLSGRLEIIKHRPLLVVDGAHTPGSVRSLGDFILDHLPKPRLLIFGCGLEKKYEEMAKILAPLFDHIFITSLGGVRPSDPFAVWEAFVRLKADAAYLTKTPQEALAKALAQLPSAASILVTGSFYLVAEIKRLVAFKGLRIYRS